MTSPPLRATPPMVLRRTLRWLGAGVVLWASLVRDRRAGRTSVRDRAVRLREAFERVGGPAVKFGQQLSIRVDMLPLEVCDELGKLTDAVPPMAWSDAEEAMTRRFGRRPDEVFAEIDRSPIGSASIATVYRAVLKSGEKVAVKVVRKGVAGQFAADLRAIDLLTELLERLTVVRPGFFANLRLGIRAMFVEELDLRLEARYQVLFARFAERDGLDWVQVPKVYRELSGTDVLVTELVDAVPLTRILAAVDRQDEAAIRAFETQDIRRDVLRDRIVTLSMWSRFESPFFHADPHPANVFVRPGSVIVLIDFGACGVNPASYKRNAFEVIRRLNVDDVPGASQVGIHNLEVLPHFDRDAFYRDMEMTLWRYFYGVRDPDAAWWERTSATLWLRIAEVSRRFTLPMSLTALRAVRSTLLYDSLAYRIQGDAGKKAVDAYLEDARRRTGRRARRDQDRVDRRVDKAELKTRLSRGIWKLAGIADQVRALQRIDVSVAARFGLSAIRALEAAALLAAALSAVALVLPPALRTAWLAAVGAAIGAVLANPLTWIVALLLMIRAVRDLRFRPDGARRRRAW